MTAVLVVLVCLLAVSTGIAVRIAIVWRRAAEAMAEDLIEMGNVLQSAVVENHKLGAVLEHMTVVPDIIGDANPDLRA
jgi:hypothetical protein